MFKNKIESPSNIPLIIIASFIVIYSLYIGAPLIIPFIIALLFSFVIIGTSHFYQKLKIHSFISMFLSLATYVVIFWLFTVLINSNIDELIKKLPDYQDKIKIIISSFFQATHIPEPKSLVQLLENFNLSNIFSLVFGAVAGVFSSAGIIFFYILFILLEYRYFSSKLSLVLTDENKREAVLETIRKIKHDTKAYFIIKTIVSLITAFSSYLIMQSFGLDFAIFWAFLIFILNFIPNIGSIIALLFPIALSLIQYDTFYPFIFISVGLIGVQILMGNIIEPKFMGNKLNLSPLAIIISLSFWGALWGVIGMLLSVPIMVIINIILSKFSSTRPIAIFLSEKGDLHIESAEEVIKTRERFIKKILKKIL